MSPTPIPHGTNAGYHRHLGLGEPPCELCREAHREYVAYRKRHPASDEVRGGSTCGVCGVRLRDHPIRACWRMQ